MSQSESNEEKFRQSDDSDVSRDNYEENTKNSAEENSDEENDDAIIVKSRRRKLRLSSDDEENLADDENVNENCSQRSQISDDEEETQPVGKRRHSDVESEANELDSDVDKVVADVFGEDYENTTDEEDVNNSDESDEAVVNDNDDGNECYPNEEENTCVNEELPDIAATEDDNEEYNNKKNIVYDFDVIMQQRKERNKKYRRSKKDSSSIVNDMDDVACQLVEKMKIVADEDRMLNANRSPATNKLKLLPTILEQVSRPDVLYSMLDNDLLRAICEWLSPMPDKSLPNIKIRDGMIRILQLIGPLNVDHLRDSGIGKAVMYLCKHPKETKDNKVKLGKLINEWSRTVFSLDTNYTTLSKEERQQRDLDHQPTSLKKRRVVRHNVNLGKALKAATTEGPKPGDPEFSMRARVPRPAPCDYVYRPVSKVSDCTKIKVASKCNRLEQFKRKAIDFKRKNQVKSAVKFSLNGAKA